MSGIFCMILPLWESRTEMWMIVRGLFGAKSVARVDGDGA